MVAGSLGFELALDLVITRAKLLRSEANRPGGMAIINASEGRIAGLIKDLNLSNQLVIAVYNGPNSHVVSGEMKAVEVFLAEAKSNAIRAKILPVGQGEDYLICRHLFRAFNSSQVFTHQPSHQVYRPFESGPISNILRCLLFGFPYIPPRLGKRFLEIRVSISIIGYAIYCCCLHGRYLTCLTLRSIMQEIQFDFMTPYKPLTQLRRLVSFWTWVLSLWCGWLCKV